MPKIGPMAFTLFSDQARKAFKAAKTSLKQFYKVIRHLGASRLPRL